jgi:NADPH2:quinone reductase
LATQQPAPFPLAGASDFLSHHIADKRHQESSSMNAAVVHSFDAPPHYTSFRDPIAGDGEVIVNITATGLHQVVRALAKGAHYGSTGELPIIPGVDGAGRLEDGTRVYFGISRSPFGSFAERTVTSRSRCFPIPAELDDVTIAALANPAMASWGALTARARFVAGENLLILGATGIAGKLAVQVGKRLGARRIVALGRDPQALAETEALGADATISLNRDKASLVSMIREELAAHSVNVVLDYLWGEPAERLLEAISQRGLQRDAARIRYVQIGSSAGKDITLSAATLRSSGLELLGSGFGSVSMKQIMQSLEEFLNEAARSPFQIEVKPEPLRDVETVWNEADRGARIVFQP